MLTKKFHAFKFIPHAKAKFFKSYWATALHPPKRCERHLALLDGHLRNIYFYKGEEGVALANIRYADNGEPIPELVNLGLGLKTRINFEIRSLITLYGGEHLFPFQAFKKGTDYRFRHVDALRYRSYGAMVLHSAPNVSFLEIPTLLGIEIVAMRALEFTPSNTLVCASYGKPYFNCRKFTPIEIRPNARKQMEEQSQKELFQISYLNSFPQITHE